MALFEPSDTDFLKIIFEASSALATAGLTCGILSSATLGSKIILIILMFIGRIGVITLGNVLLIRSVKRNRLKKTTSLCDVARHENVSTSPETVFRASADSVKFCASEKKLYFCASYNNP